MDTRELKDSYDCLDSIENHFKIEAGPGAGKTTFLANHVKRVLSESKRLKSTRKIACITYTNIGVHALKRQLGMVSQEVEVSTIHSFLYRHVLKPYFWLLDEWPFKNESIPTLYRQRLPGNIMRKILTKTNNVYLLYTHKIPLNNIRKIMEKLKWIKINNKYTFTLPNDYDRRIEVENKDGVLEMRSLSVDNFELYRKECHAENILLYEDVLYYSYLLLKNHETIREIIRAKFPYIYIDEFQDTTSLQTDILKFLSDKEVVMGVIGDKFQAIYGFTGATVKDFIDWELPNMKTYTILQNRRSHHFIVNILNYFKGDNGLLQTPIRQRPGDGRPLIIPATLEEATIFCRGEWKGDLTVLGYNFNKTVESYNPNLKEISFETFLDFLSEDSKRGRKIRTTLKAIEAFKQLDYKKAMEEIESLQKRDAKINEKEALKYLEVVRKTYKKYLDKPLRSYYNTVLNKEPLTNTSFLAQQGRPWKNYELSLRNALSAVSIEDRKHLEVQTIHSMKGDEKDNVLVSLPSKAANFLLSPKLSNKNDKHRVYYVAASRARENLAFQVDKEYYEEIKRLDNDLFRIISRDEIRSI